MTENDLQRRPLRDFYHACRIRSAADTLYSTLSCGRGFFFNSQLSDVSVQKVSYGVRIGDADFNTGNQQRKMPNGSVENSSM